MKKKVFNVLLLLSLAVPTVVYAIPATPKPVKYRQPNGMVVTLYLHGSEQNHYATDGKGYPVEMAHDGYYYYIGIDGKATDAVLTSLETASQKAHTSGISQANPDDVLKVYLGKRPVAVGRGICSGQKSPALGKRKCPVLLVEFPDIKFTHGTKERFHDMLNKHGYDYDDATGSCVDYFKDNSNGQFEPEFDVFGPVTLSNQSSYYGQNDANGNEWNLGYMVKEACQMLDSEVDFSQYDHDGDGVLDYVYIYYAGHGENDTGITSLIWPQSWYMSSTPAGELKIDGVTVNKFATSNELQANGRFVGIGTFVHEFSHVLGLPDLYATTYTNAFTPGEWSVLAHGPYNNDGRTPPNYSAYERSELGWLQLKELDTPEDITLQTIDKNVGYRISTEKSNEYYVFENRQCEGWDKYIPGHGMLVWHIDYNETRWANNLVNTNAKHQYVDIVEADNRLDEDTRAGDAFPGTYHVTSFTDDTTPAMVSWDGKLLSRPITEIAESDDGLISFKVMGGHRDLYAPTDVMVKEVRPTAFTLTWTPCKDCDNQSVSVYTKDDSGAHIYVDGYNGKMVDAATTSTEIIGLAPSTTYYAKVASLTQYQQEASEELSVKTLDPTFDMFVVETTEPTAVSDNSFTANWMPLDGAQNYELTVKKRTVDTSPETDVCDFTGKKLPEGWSGDVSSYFSASGYCGEEAPSVSLAANGQYVQSKDYGKVSSMSLWLRTMSYSSLSSLHILGKQDGKWINLESMPMPDASAGAQIVTLPKEGEHMPNGITALRMELVSTGDKAGRLLIDDIKVENTEPDHDEIFADYDHKNVGNTTSYTICGLEPGMLYLYTVRGEADGMKSIESDERLVQLDATGVRCVQVDGNIAVADGTLNVKGYAGCRVDVFTADGMAAASAIVPASGTCSVALKDGLYIVRIAGKAYKIKV